MPLQISRPWHTLSSGVTPPPLERVYLSTGRTSATVNNVELSPQVAVDLVHAHMIFPERFSTRAGVGGWLRVVDRFADVSTVLVRIIESLSPHIR